ncbi:MAG: TetR/AcrR family transcriptional regulator [Solirubrobacteraceae bacterium]
MTPQPSSDASAKPRRRYAPRMAPEQRRAQLIDAALSVIVEQGYEGVSIEAIARMAGVTRPVIYDHFPNLGALLEALIEREENYALDQLAQVVPGTPGAEDPPEQFATGVRRFLDAVASRPNTWRIILLPPEGTPSIVREHVETNRAQLLERLTGFVDWALHSAGISTEIDVEICARAILRLSEEAGRMVLTDADRFSPERYERFVRSIMQLIWVSD